MIAGCLLLLFSIGQLAEGPLTPAYQKALVKFNNECGIIDPSLVEEWMTVAESLVDPLDGRIKKTQGAVGRYLRNSLNPKQSISENKSCIAAIARLVSTEKMIPEPPPIGLLDFLYLEGDIELNRRIEQLDRRIEFWQKHRKDVILARRQISESSQKIAKLDARHGKYLPSLNPGRYGKVGNIGVFRTIGGKPGSYKPGPAYVPNPMDNRAGSTQISRLRTALPQSPRRSVPKISEFYGIRVVKVRPNKKSALAIFGGRSSGSLFWLSGVDMSGIADDNIFQMEDDELFVIIGTKTYNTVDGSTNTVFMVEPYRVGSK